MSDDYSDSLPLPPEPSSRSARKREAEALQDLGVKLVALSPERLADVPLSEELMEAIALARRIRARGGYRRQLQLIGKLMRREDTAAIRAAMAKLEGSDQAERARHRHVEHWRDRLLTDGSALTEFAAQYPNVELQRVRQLVRQAMRERDAERPPRAARELFRLIRDSTAAAEGSD